jgi:hypothetical protein
MVVVVPVVNNIVEVEVKEVVDIQVHEWKKLIKNKKISVFI